MQVGITYELLGKNQSVEKAINEVSEDHNVSFDTVNECFKKYGGLKEWKSKFKDEFYSPVPLSHLINELIHLKKYDLLKSKIFKNASKQEQEQLKNNLKKENEKLIKNSINEVKESSFEKSFYLKVKKEVEDLKIKKHKMSR